MNQAVRVNNWERARATLQALAHCLRAISSFGWQCRAHLLLAGLLAGYPGPWAASAEEPEAREIIVVLSSQAKPYKDAQAALAEQLGKQGLKCVGVQLSDFDGDRLKELLAQKPAAFVGIGSDAAQALHVKVPAEIPVVYCLVTDPQGLGLDKGRVTQGITLDVPLKSQFGLIGQALPQARTLGMLYKSKTERGGRLLKAVREALPEGWQLEAVDLDAQESVAKALETLFKRKVDVVWTAPDSAVFDASTVRALLLGALREKVPVFGFSKPFVRSGALLGVGIEPQAQGEQAAQLLTQVLRARVKPDARLVEAPAFEVALNQVVAEQLSIKFSEELTRRADGSARKP